MPAEVTKPPSKSVGSLRVVHVLTQLEVGGAQRMCLKLVSAGEHAGIEHLVVALSGNNPMREVFEDAGVAVESLGMRPAWPSPAGLLHFRDLLRRVRPHVVHGWMYHGNLVATLALLMAGDAPDLLWNIRHSIRSLANEKFTTRLVIRAGAVLSNRPRRIVYNAHRSAEQHEALGYRPDRRTVIPNGFDLEAYVPDPSAALALCDRYRLPADARLVGHLARYHPMKDHQGFLEAVARLEAPNVHVLLGGAGVEEHNRSLVRQRKALGLSDRVHFLGPVRNVPTFLAGLDLFVQSSAWGEAFPNVLGEAMACGVPCVTTDVGDAARVVGDRAGHVVVPGDPEALALACEAVLEASELAREEMGRAARERIASKFSLAVVVRSYENLYRGEAVLEAGEPGGRRPQVG